MTDAEIQSLREENEKLKANVKSYQESSTDLETLNKRLAEQEANTKKLQEENRTLVLAREKEEVLKAYPDAMSFADMIHAPDRKGMEDMAKSIAERVGKEKEAARLGREDELRKAWGNVTLPPTSHVLTEDDLKKAKEDSLAKGDLLGATKAILNNLVRKTRPV